MSWKGVTSKKNEQNEHTFPSTIEINWIGPYQRTADPEVNCFEILEILRGYGSVQWLHVGDVLEPYPSLRSQLQYLYVSNVPVPNHRLYHGNPQASFLGVMTHDPNIEGLKPSFFMGSKGSIYTVYTCQISTVLMFNGASRSKPTSHS